MKKATNRYRLNSTYWYQTTLVFDDDTVIRQLVKESGYEMPSNDAEFPMLIEKLYTNKPEFFKRMVAIILKPEIKGWRGLWNRYHRTIEAIDLVGNLTKGEIAIILADFFTMRSQWIYDLSNSKTVLASQKKYQRQIEKMSKQLERVTTLPGMTTQEQKK